MRFRLRIERAFAQLIAWRKASYRNAGRMKPIVCSGPLGTDTAVEAGRPREAVRETSEELATLHRCRPRLPPSQAPAMREESLQ